jgi:hypothetical protein
LNSLQDGQPKNRFFFVLLTVHLSIILSIDQLNAQILVFDEVIIFLYMFRALLLSSSGGQIVLIQHLVSSLSVRERPVHRFAQIESYLSTCAQDGHVQRVTIPEVVLIKFDLLMMSTTSLETCSGL